MLSDKDKYKESLVDLWSEVFGDDRSYIELIFNEEYKDSIICFAELEGDRAVSAFYLLENTLNFDNKLYHGYYLYAAATLVSYRKKGLMSALIKEAQAYCKETGIDFISLVPSEESLYSYYARYGFQKSMYRRSSNISTSDSVKIKPCDYYKARSLLRGSYINLTESTFSYAADCFIHVGADFYKNSEGLFVYLPDEDEIIEFLPDDLESEVQSESTPFGMLYPINKNLFRNWKYTDIYMNIALD